MGANKPTSTIQQAVNSGCSEIRVRRGTYHENVVIAAGQTVSIMREYGDDGARRTIVGGHGADSNFLLISGENVIITSLAPSSTSSSHKVRFSGRAGWRKFNAHFAIH
jgi:hypothetical protein